MIEIVADPGDTLKDMYEFAIQEALMDNDLACFIFDGREHIVVPGDTVEDKLREFELYGAPDPIEGSCAERSFLRSLSSCKFY